jgi:hypothetical protein
LHWAWLPSPCLDHSLVPCAMLASCASVPIKTVLARRCVLMFCMHARHITAW